MTAIRALALAIVILVIVACAGAAWYLFGPNGRPAAGMVPSDTVVFALIPNGASIGVGYEASSLKKIVEAPEAQPLLDSIEKAIGDKNLALLKLLAPELSGQSFLALTHLDPAHPRETGFVAGMRPKLGSNHFDEFVQQVNAAYPDLAKETKTGHDTLLGVDYQWIQGANAPGRVCVARYKGWILTTWGEASLQDVLERMQGKSSTPSLAENPDFQKSRDRIGSGAEAVVYGNYGRVIDLFLQQFAASNPAMAAQLKSRFAGIGGAALGTSFENGEIVDRYSVLESKQFQQASGIASAPCPFDTLKFTGPDTRLYTAANVNWMQIWKNMQDQIAAEPAAGKAVVDQMLASAKSAGYDVDKIVGALGSEYSMQIEWTANAPWPDLAIYLKVDKPADFKPAITALVNEARTAFSTTAVITEMESNGQHFATLKTVNPMPVSPTITEDGPYFGLFLNETHAVRSFARDESRGLLHNDDFNRQIGSQRTGANQIVFVDTPKLLDQTYRTALPWVSMAAMFNPKVGAALQNQKLPQDLAWLAPMGTWSAVARCDDDGITGFSTSGAGNQGLVLVAALLGGALEMQQAGLFPQTATPATGLPGNPVVVPTPLPGGPANIAAPAPTAPPPPAAPPAPPAPPATPDATTPPGSSH